MKQTSIGPSIPVDGAALRYHRLYTAHLGVVGLARESRITPQYVCAIESGRRPRVSPAVFGRLKAALGVDTNALLVQPDQLPAAG